MPSVFGCISSGSRYGNVPNELIHRAGPPFLDNHYRGYQYRGNDEEYTFSTSCILIGCICNQYNKYKGGHYKSQVMPNLKLY